MGRPKGSKNKPKDEAAQAEAPGVGHNTGDLNDAQKAELFFTTLTGLQTATGRKDSAVADIRNILKRAKQELGEAAPAMLKAVLAMENDEDNGEEKFEAQIEWMLHLARWKGMPIGTQADMFATDRRPAAERAADEGRTARLQGQPAKPSYAPGTPEYEGFMSGYHAVGEEIAARTDGEAAEAPDNVTTSFSERMRQRNAPEEKRLREQADAMADGEAATA